MEKQTCGRCVHLSKCSRTCQKTTRCRGSHNKCNCRQFKLSTPNQNNLDELNKS